MIAIPNMDKPKSCQECPAHTFDYGYIPDHDGCRILKRAFNIDKLDINPLDEVLADCQLIEIVTCKECKYWHDDGIMTTCDKHIGHGFPSDYFCADGKRRSK